MLLVAMLLALAQSLPTLDGNRVIPPAPITFPTGSSTLETASNPSLDAVAVWLASKSYVSTLRIEGHTDDQGDASALQALSEARAMAVARALVARGVDCKRLMVVGFGSTKPVADNATAEGRAQNRRIELVNAALKGLAIGGMPLDGGGRLAGDACAG